jgi:hypothetical protein
MRSGRADVSGPFPSINLAEERFGVQVKGEESTVEIYCKRVKLA